MVFNRLCLLESKVQNSVEDRKDWILLRIFLCTPLSLHSVSVLFHETSLINFMFHHCISSLYTFYKIIVIAIYKPPVVYMALTFAMAAEIRHIGRTTRHTHEWWTKATDCHCTSAHFQSQDPLVGRSDFSS